MKGMPSKEIHEDFMETLGKESPFHSTVKKWAAKFKRGGEPESVEDDGQSGSPKDANTDENVKVVQTLVMCDSRRDLQNIASEVDVPFETVQSIITDILGMSKFLARWCLDWWPMIRYGLGLIVLGIFCLAMKMIPAILSSKWDIGSALWPKVRNTEQTMEGSWRTPPKKFKRVHSAGKIVASIFLDSQMVIMIYYLMQRCVLCRRIEAASQGNHK